MHKVLVVDDSPFVWKAVRKALESEPFQLLDQAFNGKMGLEMAARCAPDVILLDITMPEMDGLQTAEQLMRKDPNTKIIFLSAMGDDALVHKAKQIGAKAFLSKPFKPDELVRGIKNIL